MSLSKDKSETGSSSDEELNDASSIGQKQSSPPSSHLQRRFFFAPGSMNSSKDNSETGSSSDEELHDASFHGQQQSSTSTSHRQRISTTTHIQSAHNQNTVELSRSTFRKTSIRRSPSSNPMVMDTVHPINAISSLDASEQISLMRSNTIATLRARNDPTREVTTSGFNGPQSALLINNV